MRGPLIFLAVVLIGGGAFFVTRPSSDASEPRPADAMPVATTTAVDAALPTLMVYKTATCGCCGAWVDHMRAAGFDVQVEDVQDLAAVKARLGIPAGMESCHTAVVGDYLVEGHVPADDVKRMLAEAPEGAGLAAPGMPVGSPGMEVPGRAADAYDVLLFDRSGGSTVWARH